MTGTDRAALRLALGTLRSLSSKWAAQAAVLYACDALAFMPDNAIGDAAMAAYGNVPERLLRARLALHLRTVLRAEAGVVRHAIPGAAGYSWSLVTTRRGLWWRETFRGVEREQEFRYAEARLAVPLWSQAPGRKT